MSYKLLVEVNNARYYKLDKTITYSVEGEKLPKPTKYVKVSDADTHTERLVFPFYFEDGYTENDLINKVVGCILVDYLEIAGIMTMAIHGGDPSTIRPDEEYLKELIEVNKKERSDLMGKAYLMCTECNYFTETIEVNCPQCGQFLKYRKSYGEE